MHFRDSIETRFNQISYFNYTCQHRLSFKFVNTNFQIIIHQKTGKSRRSRKKYGGLATLTFWKTLFNREYPAEIPPCVYLHT
jgi:hypothetical protein